MELHQVSAELDRVKNAGSTFSQPFADSDIESQFIDYQHRWLIGLRQGRIALLIFAVLSMALWDVLSLGLNDPNLSQLLIVRALTMLCVFALQKSSSLSVGPWRGFAFSLIATCVALLTAYASFLLGLEGQFNRVDSMLVGNAICLFMLDTSALRKGGAIALLNFLYLLSMILAGAGTILLMSTMISLGLFVLLSIYSLFAYERQQRENFLRDLLITSAHSSERETSVWSRHVFDSHLNLLIEEANATEASFLLAIASIDRFSHYNEHYGALSGEALLSRVSRKLKSLEDSERDVVLRLNGVEFIMIVWDKTEQEAPLVAQRMIDAIDELDLDHIQNANCSHVTLSVGVSSYGPEHPCSRSQLLSDADNALIEAKTRGGHQYQQLG